jgi:hypothetical protein
MTDRHMTSNYLRAATVMAMLAAIAGCGTTRTAEHQSGIASPRDCITLEPDVEEWITWHTNGSVTAGESVKSRKHDSIYFISAHFNIDDVNNVGTWAMSSLEPGSKTWAIDANAQRATNFDHGNEADEPLNMKEDAARASRACVPG